MTGARVGEQWRVGKDLVLAVTSPRIPCRTFAVWLDEGGWTAAFRAAARPGAYLRVLAPGTVGTGDAIEVIHRPDHDVTIGLMFRALTTERHLRPLLAAAGDDLHPELRPPA